MSDYYTGEIRLMATTFVPAGWHACDGSLLSPQAYPALYSLIGTTYGGDGARTFGLPDLRGRVPIGMGQGTGLTTRSVGQKGGAEAVSLVSDMIPQHNHALMTAGTSATTAIPGEGVTFANTQPPTIQYVKNGAPGVTEVQLNDNTLDDNASDSGSHANVMPCTPMIFMICLNGLYPVRN